MKVIVGLSGGVDSSVTALRLVEAGYEVEGLFMKNWEEDDTEEFCSAAQDAQDAEKICERLNIPFHKVNFAAEYWDYVFEHFLTEYKAGRTPNPDILCNKEIKFKAFLEYALQLGADYIATGHYARIRQEGAHYQLLKGVDLSKDQSYFLYTLGQHALSKSLFSIGDLEKKVVRQIAAHAGFQNSNKKDSTGICFIGEKRFKTFLNQYLPAQPGLIKTEAGEVIGQHDGLMFYTIGQRQGLGIGGKRGTLEQPWYVAAKDMTHNELIVVQNHQHPLLFKSQLVCEQLHWVSGMVPPNLLRVYAKIRYRSQDAACQIQQMDQTQWMVVFDEPQWAITPGQSVVFYQGEICLGGGVISA